jgi:hypothetical protein
MYIEMYTNSSVLRGLQVLLLGEEVTLDLEESTLAWLNILK